MSMQSYHALFTTKPLAMDECRRSEISNKVEEIVRFPRLAEPYLEVVQVANSKQNPTPTNCGRLTYAICFPSEKRLSLLRSCDFVQEECWVWLVSVGFAMAMTMAAAMAKSLLSVPSPAASPSVSRAALRQGSVAASLGARLPSSSLLGCALPLTRRQISGFSGLTEVLQARGLGNIARAASSEENGVLEFAKKDNRRLLHVVYRVGDLDKTIKFYTECLGMKLLRKRDITEEKYTNAFLGYGPEDSNFVVELTYNYGVDKYDIGTGFGHFGIAVEDVQKVVDLVKAKGGKVAREPGPVKGGKSIIAFVEDPDGYKFELIQRPATPEPFCQVMLRVGDLDRAVQFYEKAFGMKELRRVDVPGQEYTLAMVGYGDDEMKTTVLELTYNYGKTEYTKGNGYGQIAVGTDDVYKTAEAVNTFGGKIVREPGPLPGLNTKITAVLDPDGWKSVFVDNLDFAKELE